VTSREEPGTVISLLCRVRDRMIALTYTGVGLKKHEANMAYEF